VEEKQAINILGEILPKVDVVWYTTRDYFKSLSGKLRELESPSALSALQRVLASRLHLLLSQASSRKHHCKIIPLERKDWSLKLHIIAKSAFKHLREKQAYSELYEKVVNLKSRYNLWDDDVEVLAIAFWLAYQSNPKSIILTTTDTGMFRAIDEIRQYNKLNLLRREIRILKPSELATMLIEFLKRE